MNPSEVNTPRFLMSEPRNFDVHFLFNPWMSYRERVDPKRALRQWRSLVDAMEAAGAEIEFMEPSKESRAQTFTADGAFVYAPDRALILRNDGLRGYWEPLRFAEWFRAHEFQIESLPPRYRLDGGNLLPLDDGSLAVGLKPGSDGANERYLEKLLRMTAGTTMNRVPLVDRKFLHLDMVLGRVGRDGYLLFENGLADPEPLVTEIRDRGLEVISIEQEEARQFACNGITVNGTFITGPMNERTSSQLERLGYDVAVVELTEFYKAGGGAKCLTLPLFPGVSADRKVQDGKRTSHRDDSPTDDRSVISQPVSTKSPASIFRVPAH